MKKGKFITWIEVVFGLAALIVLASLAVPIFARVSEKGQITKGISNCKQIITMMKLYASDNSGQYPDEGLPPEATSNQAFRNLIKGGQAYSEMIFWGPYSLRRPDGKIGEAPDYEKTLEPGENHWASTRGLSESSPATMPLVYETPYTMSWPPRWTTMKKWEEPLRPGVLFREKGQSIQNRVIIGLNDSSVSLLPLKLINDGNAHEAVDSGTAKIFADHPTPIVANHPVLDIDSGNLGTGRRQMPRSFALVHAGHLFLGSVLPALLFARMALADKTRHLIWRLVGILVFAWLLRTLYRLLIEAPTYARAAGNDLYNSRLADAATYETGWQAPLFACVVTTCILGIVKSFKDHRQSRRPVPSSPAEAK